VIALNLLATAGRTLTRPNPTWDWWSLVGVVVVMVLLRSWLRSAVAWWMLAVGVVGGLAFSAAMRAWGVIPVLGAVVLLQVIGVARPPRALRS
jgi:hypothetical protein